MYSDNVRGKLTRGEMSALKGKVKWFNNRGDVSIER